MFVIFIIAQFTFEAEIDSVLKFINFTRKDITIRNDYVAPDQFRLPIITELYKQPLAVVSFVDSLALSTHRYRCDSIFSYLAELLSVKVTTGEELRLDLYALVRKLAEINRELKSAFSIAPDNLAQVFDKLTVFDPKPTETIEEEKRETRESDSLTALLKEQAEQVDYNRLLNYAYQTITSILNFPYQNFKYKSKMTISGVEGYVYDYGSADFGEYVIGSEGDNVYKKNFALIIDIGGNDIYNNIKSSLQKISIIIDLEGNDSYHGQDHSLGCGYFGIGILIDKKGDDRYEAGSFSLGSGIFGVGILIDEMGNDNYLGDGFSEGAGSFGIGILKDLKGNDSYHCAMYGQGFAKEYGIGILSDGEGNDTYFAGGKYLDEIRYEDHYLSLSQGFAIGSRPEISGGIGLLTDFKGNDNYISDIFGQGSGYWYSIGGLVDFEGNDTYVSYQYAQGCGTHQATGILIDKSGNDNYTSKGVSQGCGHDLALGFLLDEKGDDSYSAFDLSQGAGNANGYGILFDLDGNDNYLVKRRHNTQGYGDFRREYGSLGLLIDLKGSDAFTSGKNCSIWKNGRYGLGLDKE
ncbi:MAG: hypothetical protein ABIL05_02125 [candidate division WOR-3 bacterium]